MDVQIKNADFVIMICTDTYLRRVERREEPGKGRGVLWESKLIYNHLYLTDSPVQKFIPVLLGDAHPTCIPIPLRGLTYYSTSAVGGYEELYRHVSGQLQHELPKIGKLRTLPAKEPQSYPASLEARFEANPSNLDRRNRNAMLKRVRQDWIHGVLNQSLHGIARIDLGLETRLDQVERPFDSITNIGVATVTQPDASLIKIFEDYGESLLILGDPGTGKTTVLLELAQWLLDRAEQDENQPMPVVFNLSSWALRGRSFGEWLADQLNERSDVPRELARRWIQSEQVLPLLDGLDEVDPSHRIKCVEAINSFRRDHGLLPIAVCSRISDYEHLRKKLRLRHAVAVQHLTQDQVRDYLERSGESLRPLLVAIRGDNALAELLTTPLMLWIAILAYQDGRIEFLRGADLEQNRRLVIAKFVDSMFVRRPVGSSYTKKQALNWLAWLAHALSQNKQTVFYLENLNAKWLPKRAQLVLSFPGELLEGLFIAPYLLKFKAFSPMKLRLADIQWLRFSNFRSALASAAFFALTAWLLVLDYASDAILFGIVAGLLFGFPALAAERQLEPKGQPNQGTRDSIKTAVASSTAIGLISLIILWPRHGLMLAAVGGLIFGSVTGLSCGGLFATIHFILRATLWIVGVAPLKYSSFLDDVTARLFLRKVGSGYIFVHRMIMEYFASLEV